MTRRYGNRRTMIGGQFAPHTIEMLRSPAWCALSLSARRVLDRLEIELADHGGVDNGKLPVTYDDFCRYGIHRHAISPAIRETVALGFLVVTEQGRAGNAEFRKPNLFRLTYRHTRNMAPTDEWRRISTDELAAETKRQCRKTPNISDGNQHRKPQIHSTETSTTSHSAETITTIDISGRKQRTEPTSGSVASSHLIDLVRARGWVA
jgi:hypothetical protein